MKIIITERQFKLIEHIIDSINDFDDDNNEPNVFTYKSLRSFSVGTTKLKYFNNLEPLEYDPSIPDNIKLIDINDNETYIVDKSEFVVGVDKFGNKNGKVTEDYFLKKFSFNQNNISSELLGITSTNIRKALKDAYPNNWFEKDDVFSAGLRGVETIGSYSTPKTNETWSIMNFFDTKKEVHDELRERYLSEETNENIVKWLTKVFNPTNLIKDKDKKVSGENFLKKLIKIQIDSYISGFNTESESVTFFLKTLPKNTKVTTYPPGAKMDRYCGVDVTINDVNYQIKPLKDYSTNYKGQMVITTYNMKDYTKYRKTYDKKDNSVICPGVDKIAFSNKEQSLVFDNKDYELKTKSKVIFNNKPEIYK